MAAPAFVAHFPPSTSSCQAPLSAVVEAAARRIDHADATPSRLDVRRTVHRDSVSLTNSFLGSRKDLRRIHNVNQTFEGTISPARFMHVYAIASEIPAVGSDKKAAESSREGKAPLLLRAIKGEALPRPPVWLMRQAGRYMKEFRDVSEKYSFREKSETADIATELSLQPWHAYQPDGVILFSDILTPLPGMGIEFDIVKGKGPRIPTPIRSVSQIDAVRPLDPHSSLSFVGEILGNLRAEVGDRSTVLGFVGSPWTLAAYAIEGRSSALLSQVKNIAFAQPEAMHRLLDTIADSIARYACYQIASGAQAVQIFDSWGGHLSPADFKRLSLPYISKIVEHIRKEHPGTPVMLYANCSGGLLELMADSGVDVVSVDWTVDMADARQRLGDNMVLQGNVDPGALFGSKEFVRARVDDCIRKAGPRNHIMNLGHGVIKNTPYENVLEFVDAVRRGS